MLTLEEQLSPESLALLEKAKRIARKEAKRKRKQTTAERAGRKHGQRRLVTLGEYALSMQGK